MYYGKEKEDIFKELHSSLEGLNANQVEKSRTEFGENRLYEKKKKSLIQIFISQFKDLLVLILIVAAVISILTGSMESAIVILAVIILNAVLGTVQYVKAEKSLDSLKQLSAPLAKVIRGGKSLTIPASELVVGDIVELEAGDIVPGDGRIVENHSLKTDESALTGESESVQKDDKIIKKEKVALGDQLNMVFSGSMVTYGRAAVIITHVGIATELGKIAALMSQTQERKTPLQVSMDEFSKKLSLVIIAICIVVFGLNLFRGMEFLDSMLFAVALAVAAIPEALSSIITISLAIGTSKMAKEKAIVKQLEAVEGLGCVSIICSDKTGTLTQNKMTVEEIYCETLGEELLLQASILCNDTVIEQDTLRGDPTETALVDYYFKVRKNYESIKQEHRRIAELPFDSERKRMSTLHNEPSGTYMITKGAVDGLLNKVTTIWKNGKAEAILPQDIQQIEDKNEEYSSQGLRVLAFAQKKLDRNVTLTYEQEENYTFLGLIAMMDPPREESKKAVADCRHAGIKPIMITGDHKITASAIARKIGILTDHDRAITGAELDLMSEDQLRNDLEHIAVYARVSPDNKIRIVNAWQEKGHIVAMTGDGVNDAPALKKADIGIAMGITGTQVAKDAASMILADDNFATIIKSVLNGRNIYANITNAIKFLLSGNAAGIFLVLFASLAALPTPFQAVHLLFINLLTDSLPALSIGMEPSNPKLIGDAPRGADSGILTKKVLTQVVLQGVLIGVCTLSAFISGLQISSGTGMTMAFATLCLARLWHGFNSRGDQSIFQLGLFSNLYTIGAFFLGILLLMSVLFIPVLQNIFEVSPLLGEQFGIVLFFAFLPTLVIQLAKVIAGLVNKRK
ncbi:MAG: calcium-translocating P-type ATPase, PMCA-type [Lachnospiraceae bacterium]